ncbi:MAG TPA: hypothetical protein VGA71_05245, partial [Actinomycetota bacterium]
MTRGTGALLVLALALGLLAGCGRARPAAVTFSAKDADFRAVFPVTPSPVTTTIEPPAPLPNDPGSPSGFHW